MSDIEKAYARANLLGSGTPLQLRWEGAGDATHAEALLIALQSRLYTGSTQKIKYHAVINIYESETSEIYKAAWININAGHLFAEDYQTFEMHADADVTRPSQAFGQHQAHIMFIRNIMLTDSSGASLTDAKNELATLHKDALRTRANSLEGGGQIRLGMSGRPGLKVGVDRRDTTPVNRLFFRAKELMDTASTAGLTLQGTRKRVGGDDTDSAEVMKNSGVSLGVKPTYYLVFQK